MKLTKNMCHIDSWENMTLTDTCVTLTVDVHNELETQRAFGRFIYIHHIGHNLKWFAVGLLHQAFVRRPSLTTRCNAHTLDKNWIIIVIRQELSPVTCKPA